MPVAVLSIARFLSPISRTNRLKAAPRAYGDKGAVPRLFVILTPRFFLETTMRAWFSLPTSIKALVRFEQALMWVLSTGCDADESSADGVP